MSHITRIKTNITEKSFLLMALNDLGYKYEDGEHEIAGFAKQKTRVEIKIPLSFSNDIGFRKSGERYELVADWFGVIGVNKEKFINNLHQRYAYHVTRSKLEEKGFTLVEEKSENKNQIRLILRRMD